ncbi:MAG TPA: Ni/Fe hydrogenase subunit alpha [Clostridia bacterium]|nr:Ni/Fe hydrogenase subunit alpha [Clostridia bacterium]
MTRALVVPEISRVEGHGRIRVEISDGKVTEVKLGIFEGPRFFEAVARGRRYDEVPEIMCRICAICSAGHKVTSILAVEDALGIQVSRQTELLRELYFLGMMIESHSLHLYFLALPDYLGYTSAIELVPKYADKVQQGLHLKRLGNRIQERISGRPIHGPNAVVGGFGKVPEASELVELKEELKELLPAAEDTVHLFAKLDYPEFTKAFTVFFALRPKDDKFSFFGNGSIACSSGDEIPLERYDVVCDERVLDYSTAKHSYSRGDPFMVGALARVNLFHKGLTPVAASALKKTGWKLPSNNTLHNNLAQAVELVYSVERAIDVIDQLLEIGPVPEKPVKVDPAIFEEGCSSRVKPASGKNAKKPEDGVQTAEKAENKPNEKKVVQGDDPKAPEMNSTEGSKPGAGGSGNAGPKLVDIDGEGYRGIAATEVPRGTLYHDYKFDKNGRLVWANVVTPTAQNAANIERDLRACALNTIHREDDEIKLYLEMVARAYDPCISCSAHLVDLVVKRS